MPEETSTPPKQSGEAEAPLEMSSITFNAAYDFLSQFQPVHFIFVASLPLCLGAFAGYRVEMKNIASSTADQYSPGSTASGGGLLRRVMSEEMRSSFDKLTNNNSISKSSSKKAIDASKAAVENVEMKRVKSDVGRIAFKALGLGSMLSIGGVGLLTGFIFMLSGSASLQEMLQTWREWTPRQRKALEDKLGIDPKSLQHEDVKATKGMTEEQEWEFIKKKYIPELIDDASNEDSEGK